MLARAVAECPPSWRYSIALTTFIFAIYLGCAARSVFSKEGACLGGRLGPSAAVLTAATHGVSLLGSAMATACSLLLASAAQPPL